MFKLKRLLSLAVVVAIVSLLAINLVQAQDDPVELIFIYGTQPTDADALPAVQEALDALFEERGLNFRVELRPLEFPSFRERMPLINASGEEFDIVFTAPWINNFFQNVADGNLLALNDYLDDFPVLAAEFDENLLAVTTVNGNIYALPGRQWFPKPFGFAVNENFGDAYGLDAETVQSITSFEELTPYMVAMKEGEGESFYPLGGTHILPPEVFGYDPLVNIGPEGAVAVPFDADPSNPVAVNVVASEEYREFMHLRREWQELELTPFDPLTREEATDGLANELHAIEFGQQERPNTYITYQVRFGVDFGAYSQSIAPLVLTTGSMNATMLAVSADSDHPLEALQFLELLQTDPEVFNLLAKGVEGINWNFVDEERGIIEFTEDNTYTPNVDWVFGNSFIAYVTDAEQLDWVEQSIEANTNSAPSPVLGFVPDTQPVELEIASLSAITAEYTGILWNGLAEDVDATLDEYLAALDSAGMQTVLDEINGQIQAWLETQ